MQNPPARLSSIDRTQLWWSLGSHRSVHAGSCCWHETNFGSFQRVASRRVVVTLIHCLLADGSKMSWYAGVLRVSRRRKAFRNYEILEKMEAGIELVGSEVKSCRDSRISLDEGFAQVTWANATLFPVFQWWCLWSFMAIITGAGRLALGKNCFLGYRFWPCFSREYAFVF